MGYTIQMHFKIFKSSRNFFLKIHKTKFYTTVTSFGRNKTDFESCEFTSPWTVQLFGGVLNQHHRWRRDGKEIRGRIKCVASDKGREGEWGDKMLEFPAYCLGAGLAGAKWAQAPSGRVSVQASEGKTPLMSPCSFQHWQMPMARVREREREKSISHYITRARNLHNKSCASLCIDGLKIWASPTEKQRETWHERISWWWENIYLYLMVHGGIHHDKHWTQMPIWNIKSSASGRMHSHWKPDSAAAVVCEEITLPTIAMCGVTSRTIYWNPCCGDLFFSVKRSKCSDTEKMFCQVT